MSKNANEIEINVPDSFSEIMKPNKNLTRLAGDDEDNVNSQKAKTSRQMKKSKISKPLRIRNPNRKRRCEKEWDDQLSQIRQIEDCYFFGLNYFTWTSKFRSVLECLVELATCVLMIVFILKQKSKIFETISLIITIKHLLLIFDFGYVCYKKELFISDFFFGVSNLAYWVFFPL
jgi:hypothetical protein